MLRCDLDIRPDNPAISFSDLDIGPVHLRIARRSWALPLAITRGTHYTWVTVGPLHFDWRHGTAAGEVSR